MQNMQVAANGMYADPGQQMMENMWAQAMSMAEIQAQAMKVGKSQTWTCRILFKASCSTHNRLRKQQAQHLTAQMGNEYE